MVLLLTKLFGGTDFLFKYLNIIMSLASLLVLLYCFSPVYLMFLSVVGAFFLERGRDDTSGCVNFPLKIRSSLLFF